MRHTTVRNFIFAIVSMCGFMWITTAEATVQIHIDLSTQRMHVHSDQGDYTWRVSTARAGYFTPRGTFHPQSLQRMHYSKKYHMAPMPYSIFFRGGFAIHGSYETAYLGHPASHGCVRLLPAHAAILFRLVKAEGATITITGTPPRTRWFPRRRRQNPVAPSPSGPPQRTIFGFDVGPAPQPQNYSQNPRRSRRSQNSQNAQGSGDSGFNPFWQ